MANISTRRNIFPSTLTSIRPTTIDALRKQSGGLIASSRTLIRGSSRVINSQVSTRTPVIMPSTTLTSRVTTNLGSGIGTRVTPALVSPTATPPTALSGIGIGVTNASTNILGAVGSYIPLAIKIVTAVIVIKVVLWIVRAGGKRR